MSDLESRRHSVGVIAVQLGLITQKQLMDSVRLQSGEMSDKSIDQILVSQGHLTEQQVESILLEIAKKLSGGPLPSDRPTRATSVKKRETAGRPKPLEEAPTVKPGDVPIPAIPSQADSQPRGGTTGRRKDTVKATVSATVPGPEADVTPAQRGTSVHRRGTTSKHFNPPKERATAFIRKETPPARKPWALIFVLIAVSVVGLVVYIIQGKSNPAVVATASNTPAPSAVPSPTSSAAGVPYQRTTTDPKPGKVILPPLSGTGPIVSRWNDLVQRLKSIREPEQYKAYLPDLERLITDAKGTPHEDVIVLGYRDIMNAIRARAEEVFEFIAGEVALLCKAGKFGDALVSWDWFPRHLDPAGLYSKKIDEKREETRGAAKVAYGAMRDQAQVFSDAGKLSDAKLLLLKALEIGVPEYVDDAYKRLTGLVELEDAQFRKAEEAQLVEFEKAKNSERESAKLIAVYRSQFWDLVVRRNFAAVDEFLTNQRKGAAGDIANEIDTLKKTVVAMRKAFELVGMGLQTKVGSTLTLSLIENGKATERSIKLQRVERDTFKYLVEGKEFTADIAILDSREILKIASGIPDSPPRSLLNGLGRMLANEFQEAHVELKNAGESGAPLLSFVEGSASFLARNAPAVRASAKAAMDAKQWDKAAEAFTRLSAIPAERVAALKGRARAYYQMNNFVGTVLDVESLFEMDDFSEEVIDLLNQSYKRATLISKAIRIYEAVVKRVNNVTILVNLVRLYMQIHEFDRAIEVLKEANKLGGVDLGRGFIELLHLMAKPPFPGQTFKAMFGRYEVVTDISQEYATDMARFMDSVYRNYTKVFPYKKNEALRFHVLVFSSESDFIRYSQVTGGMYVPPGSRLGAYYSPSVKQLVGFKDPKIKSTMTHEGLHQYMDYFVDDCPIWFNEGYASYFEYSTADEAKFNPERHQTALELLQSKKLPSLKELFLMERNTFQAQGHLQYGSSWAMIYWLTKSGQRNILDRYFEDLMAGKTKEQAYENLFGPGKLNMEAFNAKWRSAIFKDDYETP